MKVARTVGFRGLLQRHSLQSSVLSLSRYQNWFFSHTSWIIVGTVQDILMKYYFVDVGSFVNFLPGRPQSHVSERKRCWSGPTVCQQQHWHGSRENIECVLNTEIGIVPVIEIVPVVHRKLHSRFGDDCWPETRAVCPDLTKHNSPFEISLVLNIVSVYIHDWKISNLFF